MRAFSLVAPLFFVASSLAQAVEEGIAPDSPPPKGCETTVQGNFTIGVQNFFAAGAKRETAQEAADGLLLCNLEDGILRDQYNRIGSVVANYQFQFDGPPQAGAIYTGGFSVCQNRSLAIGGSSRWWRCMSGEFGNLYDRSIGEQCTEIRILVDMVNKPTPSKSSAVLASSTSHDLTLATSAIHSASVSSGNTDGTSHGTTSGAYTGMVTQTASPSASLNGTVISHSSASPGPSETSIPEAPEASGGASHVGGAVIWSLLVIVGATIIL